MKLEVVYMKRLIGWWILLLLLPEVVMAVQADALSRLQSEAARRKDLQGYVGVCSYLSENGVYPELLSAYADSIRQLAVRDKSASAFVEYYAYRGEACFVGGNFTEGYQWKRKALALAETLGKTQNIVTISGDLGYYYNVDTRYDSARYYLKKGMEAAAEQPELSGYYRTMLTNYASSYLFEGKADSALHYTLLAKERSLADRDTALLIENLNQLGTLYRRKKKLSRSIEHFKQALQLCELKHNYRAAAYIYGNIATVYCEWNAFEEAVSFSEKAVEYALKWGNPQMACIFYTNLGAVLCNVEGKEAEAIQNLQKAVEVSIEVGNNRRLCEAYSYLVGAFSKIGQMDAAETYVSRLDSLTNVLQTDAEFFRYYQAKASLLQANGRYGEAAGYYRRIVEMMQHGFRNSKDYETYLHFAECLHVLQDNAAAYRNLHEAYALRDSSFRAEYNERLSDFSVRYKTQEKELEIARLQQKELERKGELLHNRIVLGASSAVFLIVLLLFLYARQRQKVRIARLAQAAGEKERQFLALQKDTEQRLTRKYIEGLESERERMATELHDDVCNSLLALAMNVRSSLESGTPHEKGMDEQLARLDEIRERLRNISHELMPPVFQYATIDEMLADYVAHLPLPEGLRAEYRSTEGGDWKLIPQQIGFEFYRIVQEVVSNTLKYASASLLQVELTWKDAVLSVSVCDNGKGFDPHKKRKGIGLETVRQRVQTIGAVMSLDAAPGKGMCLKVMVNYPLCADKVGLSDGDSRDK